jgi:hypothetical protein
MRLPFALRPSIPFPRFAYSYQTFSVGQVLTAAQVQQIEDNVRDHVHGVSSVAPQPGANLVLIDSQSASSSAQIDFTLSSSYDDYVLVMRGVVPATNGTTFRLQVDTAGGGVQSGASDYDWIYEARSTGGGTAATEDAAETSPARRNTRPSMHTGSTGTMAVDTRSTALAADTSAPPPPWMASDYSWPAGTSLLALLASTAWTTSHDDRGA